MPVPAPVTVRVPAKVNLHLGVGPLRPDGFHELSTVFHAVGLYDELTVAAGPGLSVAVTGPGADGVPADESNLAVRAAALLAEATGVAPAARLTIRKEIPVAGGMAGGSADAAAALVACDAFWGTRLARERLLSLAAELGSDVPFALQGGTALGTGRGEVLTPALARGRLWWVLAVADGGLSTPAVYAELDRQRAQQPKESAALAAAASPDVLLAALRTGDPRQIGPALHNDLQEAALALRPALRAALAAGLELGAVGGVVSGSGPTCAFLAKSQRDAVRIGAALAAEDVCKTTRVVDGPVPGARVG